MRDVWVWYYSHLFIVSRAVLVQCITGGDNGDGGVGVVHTDG